MLNKPLHLNSHFLDYPSKIVLFFISIILSRILLQKSSHRTTHPFIHRLIIIIIIIIIIKKKKKIDDSIVTHFDFNEINNMTELLHCNTNPRMLFFNLCLFFNRTEFENLRCRVSSRLTMEVRYL